MKPLRTLLPASVIDSRGNLDAPITAVAFDSRRCSDGTLFVALPGAAHDGAAFIADAIAKGAAAVVTEGSLDGLSVPCVRVANARQALSFIAKAFYDHPSARMKVIGITGTKGKTTSTYLTQSILKQHYGRAFRFGTVEYDLGFTVRGARNTTPESLEIASMLNEALTQQVQTGVMEVSSHALKTWRVEDLTFAAAGFTNLTLEHTEFHPDMEDYFQAKRRLFCELLPADRTAVVGIDDDYGVRLVHELQQMKRLVKTVSVTGRDADIRVEELNMQSTMSRFVLATEGRRYPAVIHLPGPFNVFNAALSAGLTRTIGVPWSAIVTGLDELKQVPGRFESIANDRGITVIVDYAHSPASLENVLKAVRTMTSKRVISVFGCGGNRSSDKRPIMGRLSAMLADVTIVTSDNPRKEDPHEIVKQIMVGVDQLPTHERHEVLVEVDRRKAIAQGIAMAQPGDVVLIAGKGHETGQTFADRTIPFDDREVAREILQAKECKHG